METQFELLRATRKNLLTVLQETSPETLLAIPTGFNNNILWNVYHMLVGQQLLIYGLSQTPLRLEADFIHKFKGGTKPSGEQDLAHLDYAKALLLPTVDQLKEDYAQAIFGTFKSLQTRYGPLLQSVEDAIYFNNVHEAMHFGQIRAMERVVQ